LNNCEYSRPKEAPPKRAARIFIALAIVWLGACLAMWGAYHWEPLRDFLSVRALTELSQPLARHPAAPLIIAAAYFGSVFIVLPRPVLTLPAVIVLGPWLTFFSGMTGLLLGAVCGFWIGGKLTGEKLASFTRAPLLRRLEEKLRHGGVGAVVVVRLVPVAPFMVVNMAFGILRIRIGDFVMGTFLGLLPGFLFSIFIGDRVRLMLHDHGAANLFVLAVQIIGAGVVLFLLWRMASAKYKEK
jgi:phospholipase D1/2